MEILIGLVVLIAVGLWAMAKAIEVNHVTANPPNARTEPGPHPIWDNPLRD